MSTEESEPNFLWKYRNDLESLEGSTRLLRFVSPASGGHCTFQNDGTVKVNAGLWTPVHPDTATRLGYQYGAASVYVADRLGDDESPGQLADKTVQLVSGAVGIAFITVDQVLGVAGVGLFLDEATHPAHGVLFRLDAAEGTANPAKLSGAQRKALAKAIQDGHQLLRPPIRELEQP